MPKKFLRSDLVKRPFPSAILAAMDRARAVQLIGQEAVAVREAFGDQTHAIGESNRLLINIVFLEGEGHTWAQKKRRGESSE